MVELRQRRAEEIRMTIDRSSNQFQWADGITIVRPVDCAARSFRVSRQSILSEQELAAGIQQFTAQ